MNWIEELKSRIRISEVVSNYCKMSPRSKMIKCPFHADKTPSLSIEVAKNIFHCFGCGAGGDAIKFIQLIERLNFMEACTKLAHMYGITKPNYSKKSVNPLELLVNWSIEQLQKNFRARAYLEERGLKNISIRDFRIGWLGNYNEVSLFCEKNKLTPELLGEYGLPYSLLKTMCNRIIFPIGRPTIALAGRTLSDARPKYLNSGESHLFKKRNTLYGLHKSADSIFLVEGYIDVCVCYQAGLNVAGSMGTAISSQSIKQLWQTNDHVILCFDGDLAGRKASDKLAFEILSEIIPGKTLSFIDLPQGEDPASFILSGKDLKSIPEINLIDKIWSLSGIEGSPEIKVGNYNKLIKSAEAIKDFNLRKLYLVEWKKLWLRKEAVIKKTSKINMEIYENILISIIINRIEIFDYICDYLIAMPLNNAFNEIREILIKNPNKTVDLLRDSVIKSNMNLYTLNTLSFIAPFINGNVKEVVVGWLEIFSFYQRTKGVKYE